jgi:hypothetical protein
MRKWEDFWVHEKMGKRRLFSIIGQPSSVGDIVIAAPILGSFVMNLGFHSFRIKWK